MPRMKGKFDIAGNDIFYEWQHNKLLMFSRIGEKLAFSLQPNGLESREPRQLAIDVFESALTQGFITQQADFRREGVFLIVHTNSSRPEHALHAILNAPGAEGGPGG